MPSVNALAVLLPSPTLCPLFFLKEPVGKTCLSNTLPSLVPHAMRLSPQLPGLPYLPKGGFG